MRARRHCAFHLSLAGAIAFGGVHCASRPVTYRDYADQAVAAAERMFYTGQGTFFVCEGGCGAHNLDWGSDSLAYALYLRWSVTHDATLVPVFAALASTASSHVTCDAPDCGEFSDVPEWDVIADVREFEVTGDARALTLAEQTYAAVRDATAFALGACPGVRYQEPFGGGGGLKTLETDSNAIKAALLLWRTTGEQRYLDDAAATYAAVRQAFLDPALPLYTVYVYDDGVSCPQLPARFFASVNGNMIWNGVALASATGEPSYLDEATATAGAVDRSLSDARGIFADLQAENDVVEPLVEAFYVLATERGVGSARDWIMRNARAALASARTDDGLFGRFFDGPAPNATLTDWQVNGGLALSIAAGSLGGGDPVPPEDGWSGGRSIREDIASLPASLSFSGSGIALFGTLGEQCCEPGHASVTLDGTALVDATGIWQNKSSAGRAFPDATLFAWRWPVAGEHVLALGVPTANVKEGGPFLHVRRYVVLP